MEAPDIGEQRIFRFVDRPTGERRFQSLQEVSAATADQNDLIDVDPVANGIPYGADGAVDDWLGVSSIGAQVHRLPVRSEPTVTEPFINGQEVRKSRSNVEAQLIPDALQVLG